MKIALQSGGDGEHMQFIRQLGLTHVVSGATPSTDGILALDDLRRRKDFFAEHDCVGRHRKPSLLFCYNDAMFGREGRDRQIDNVCESIRNMGEVGIGVLQYQWMLLGGLRTKTGRGGARYPRFDMEIAERMPAACLDWLGKGPDTPIRTYQDRDMEAEEVWRSLSRTRRAN